MMRLLFSALAVSFLTMGCAEPQTVAKSGADADEGEVLTGSRIPRKVRQNAEGTRTVTGGGYKTDQQNTNTIGNAPRGN